MKMGDAENFRKIADEFAAKFNTDILVYDGHISRPFDDDLINMCCAKERYDNVMLFLRTNGGNPHAAYRISRCLQHRYKSFSVYISDFCKSAGSLLCLGADLLIMDPIGEMGPLDIQVQKPDELYEMSSGLNVMNALTITQAKAYSMLEDFVLNLKDSTGRQITLKTATDIAAKMAVGLFGKIYEQIDPVNLGEISRSMKIAEEYGRRLNQKSGNAKDKALSRLIADYPAHDFVIDRMEAAELFENVREPSSEEAAFCKSLYEFVLTRKLKSRPFVQYVTGPRKRGDTNGKENRKGAEGTRQENSGSDSGVGPKVAVGNGK